MKSCKGCEWEKETASCKECMKCIEEAQVEVKEELQRKREEEREKGCKKKKTKSEMKYQRRAVKAVGYGKAE